jgi:hypothetical protein
MGERNRPPDRRTSSRVESKKKPYVKPAFQRQSVFETNALACGKIYDTQRQCHAHQAAS